MVIYVHVGNKLIWTEQNGSVAFLSPFLAFSFTLTHSPKHTEKKQEERK